jgi:probable phosphoglycerate mutase
LTRVGRRQALALGRRLKNIPFEEVYTSPLLRTVQTARIAIGLKNIEPTIDVRLIETNHGVWEGMHKDEVARRWPTMYALWQTRPSRVEFAGGESFLETQRRVLLWWRDYTIAPKDVLVVAHDNIVRILIAHVLRIPLDHMWGFRILPASLSTITIEKESAFLEGLNDINHLQGIQGSLAKHAL